MRMKVFMSMGGKVSVQEERVDGNLLDGGVTGVHLVLFFTPHLNDAL